MSLLLFCIEPNTGELRMFEFRLKVDANGRKSLISVYDLFSSEVENGGTHSTVFKAS